VGALAGLLPNPSVELSVHYLLFTATLASYMIFSGLSVSVSVLVGQKLGLAGQSGNAKQSAIVGTSACLCVSGLLILFLLFFHDLVGRSLTSQPKLLERFTECVPVLIAYQAVDGLNTCSTQLLRTLGVQKYGVLLHFTTYYVVGMTSGYTLAFPLGYGVKGLWIGLCIGVGLNACFATYWLWFRADWEEQSNAAIDRTVSMQDAAQQSQPRTSPSYLSNAERNMHGKAVRDEQHGV
jgi:MATE family multidrug resistance protein